MIEEEESFLIVRSAMDVQLRQSSSTRDIRPLKEEPSDLGASVVSKVSRIEQVVFVEEMAQEVNVKYQDALKHRSRLTAELKAFKESLGKTEQAELPACFSEIQTQSGRDDIRLNHDLEIDLSEEQRQSTSEACLKSIEYFNDLMRHCSEFLVLKNDIEQFIKDKLVGIKHELDQYATMDTKRLCREVEDKLSAVEGYGREIAQFHSDVQLAQEYLNPRPMRTGLIAVLPH